MSFVAPLPFFHFLFNRRMSTVQSDSPCSFAEDNAVYLDFSRFLDEEVHDSEVSNHAHGLVSALPSDPKVQMSIGLVGLPAWLDAGDYKMTQAESRKRWFHDQRHASESSDLSSGKSMHLPASARHPGRWLAAVCHLAAVGQGLRWIDI